LKNQLTKITNSTSSVENKKNELNRLRKELTDKLYGDKSKTANLRRRINDLKDEISSERKLITETKQIKNLLEETKIHEEDLQKEKNRILERLWKYEQNLQKLVTQSKDKEVNKLKQQITRQSNELKIIKKINTLLFQLQIKETELKELTNIITIKNELGKKGKRMLEKLLEEQKKIILNNANDNFAAKKLKEIKQKLNEEELIGEEIQNILNKQAEITLLKIHLKSLQNQEQQYDV
jgi:hypothetical protein